MVIIPFQSRLLDPLRIATRVNMLLASEETREEVDENSPRSRRDTLTLQTRSLAWSKFWQNSCEGVWRGPQEWRLHRQNSHTQKQFCQLRRLRRKRRRDCNLFCQLFLFSSSPSLSRSHVTCDNLEGMLEVALQCKICCRSRCFSPSTPVLPSSKFKFRSGLEEK